MIQSFPHIIATLGLILGGISITIATLYLLAKKVPFAKTNLEPIRKNGLFLALLVATMAVISPLIFSQVLHYEPCVLCWYQRAFMFPLVPILFIATLKKESGVKKYVLPLSIIGSCIALWQYLGQMIGDSLLAVCETGAGPSCAEIYMLEYGFVTIPLVSLIAFLTITLLVAIAQPSR